MINLFGINLSDLSQAGNIFWQGMLAMLIVITAVFIATIVMVKVSDYRSRSKEIMEEIKLEEAEDAEKAEDDSEDNNLQ